MARIRKGVAYRKLERPYTRVSKYKAKAFVKTRPHLQIVKFDMGSPNKTFPWRVDLVSKSDFQARHNALESARQTANRQLESDIGKNDFHFKVRAYPHHILRENPLASGAGADRMSTGMSRSFGKVIGAAAQIRIGQSIMSVYCNKNKTLVAKQALEKAAKKLPVGFRVAINEQ